MAKRPTTKSERVKRISLAPLSEDEALSLLLKTPPPPKAEATKREVVKKRKRR